MLFPQMRVLVLDISGSPFLSFQPLLYSPKLPELHLKLIDCLRLNWARFAVHKVTMKDPLALGGAPKVTRTLPLFTPDDN